MRTDDERVGHAYELKCIRELVGLSVSEVARRAGLDRSTISTYEARRALPSRQALARWQAAVRALALERRNNAQTAANMLAG